MNQCKSHDTERKSHSVVCGRRSQPEQTRDIAQKNKDKNRKYRLEFDEEFEIYRFVEI